ncbi:MAG: ferritin-like domain-containing protein [Gaiellaceae bacterium]
MDKQIADTCAGEEDDGAAVDLTLAELDSDGAIGEALAGLYGDTRASFLCKAAIGGAGVAAALALPSGAAAAKIGDTGILNFDLVFEYLQSNFYTQADRLGTVKRMSNPLQIWARTLGAHERAHVAILKNVLGRAAVRSPFFDFRGVTDSPAKFLKTAVAMEDLTVALLVGQAARFKNRDLSAAVFSLLTVEARHAAWARRLVGTTPVRSAVDQPRTLAQVATVVARTHFVARRPSVETRRSPPFTG